MYLFAPSIFTRDLLTNFGLERTLLLTLGSSMGSSKSALVKPRLFGAIRSLTRFCCYLMWVLVMDLLMLVVCCTVPILFTEFDLRIFGGPSIKGIRGVTSLRIFSSLFDACG